MATDTAHIKLELASGRNEVTAPFHQTARQRRNPIEEPPIEAVVTELATSARIIVDVPVGMDEAPVAPPVKTEITRQPSSARPTWIAFIGATIAVAMAVWWVMFQRLPDIDPREVIERNLIAAQSAMAEGRYTDPSERSAFHYYNTVLALDPDNADAIAGIDAIADRHLTDARMMLAERRVADAVVALDRARRVRPHHSSLPILDSQLRMQLKKIMAAANADPQIQPVKAKVAKAPTVAAPPSQPLLTQKKTVAPSPAATPSVAKVPALLSLAPIATEQTSPALIIPAAEESGSAPVIDEPVNTPAATAALPEAAPEAVPPVTPKLLKMVQPEYPQEALMRGIEGWVDVSMEITAAGDVIAPRVEESSRGRLFNRAALNAVQQWKYEPHDGNNSERLRVRLQFRTTK